MGKKEGVGVRQLDGTVLKPCQVGRTPAFYQAVREIACCDSPDFSTSAA